MHVSASRMEPIARGVSLARRTSFRIGGVAKEYYAPRTLDELRDVLRTLHARGERPFILGGGANTLFPDGEFSRPVVSTEELRRVEVRGTSLLAECGVRLNALIRAAIHSGLAGLEVFVGIPGTAGGAAVMNAGGGGWSFGERVREIGLIPIDGGAPMAWKGPDVRWGYRSADLGGHVVAWVELDLSHGRVNDLRARAKDLMLRKAKTQPLADASAGCIFKNPPGDSAARLIDTLGLKGLVRGGAQVSERHANFIVNATGKARAADVVALLEEVRGRVAGAFGISLETEIVLPGVSRC
jgi:UDP-N-acetylmuramate dehydrogenase